MVAPATVAIAPVVVFSVQSISLSIAAGDAQADYAGETLASLTPGRAPARD